MSVDESVLWKLIAIWTRPLKIHAKRESSACLEVIKCICPVLYAFPKMTVFVE